MPIGHTSPANLSGWNPPTSVGDTVSPTPQERRICSPRMLSESTFGEPVSERLETFSLCHSLVHQLQHLSISPPLRGLEATASAHLPATADHMDEAGECSWHAVKLKSAALVQGGRLSMQPLAHGSAARKRHICSQSIWMCMGYDHICGNGGRLLQERHLRNCGEHEPILFCQNR